MIKRYKEMLKNWETYGPIVSNTIQSIGYLLFTSMGCTPGDIKTDLQKAVDILESIRPDIQKNDLKNSNIFLMEPNEYAYAIVYLSTIFNMEGLYGRPIYLTEKMNDATLYFVLSAIDYMHEEITMVNLLYNEIPYNIVHLIYSSTDAMIGAYGKLVNNDNKCYCAWDPTRSAFMFDNADKLSHVNPVDCTNFFSMCVQENCPIFKYLSKYSYNPNVDHSNPYPFWLFRNIHSMDVSNKRLEEQILPCMYDLLTTGKTGALLYCGLDESTEIDDVELMYRVEAITRKCYKPENKK